MRVRGAVPANGRTANESRRHPPLSRSTLAQGNDGPRIRQVVSPLTPHPSRLTSFLKVTGILLAAGSGSRFGGGKIAHPLPDGTPIGVASLRNLREALSSVVVVIRGGDASLRKVFEDEGVPVLECGDAQLGMSRSLACGVNAARDATAWLFALGDMPFLKPQTLRSVAQSIGNGIAIPEYAGQRGNPVGFANRYREELLALKGDEGARSLLGRHPHDVTVVACDDPGILRDIDRREDLG